MKFWYITDAERNKADFDATKTPSCILWNGNGCTTDPTSITWAYDLYKKSIPRNDYEESSYKTSIKDLISVVANPGTESFLSIEEFFMTNSLDACGNIIGIDFRVSNYCEIKELYSWFEELSADDDYVP